MTIIPEADGSYTARCTDCVWSMTVGSESFAEEMGDTHRRFMRHDEARDALARYAALPPAVDPNDLHQHSPACTDASCPGQGFPTREELISARHARYSTRTQDVGSVRAPGTTTVDKSPHDSREVPV